MTGDACVIGVDFGSESARALVVRVADGVQLGAGVHQYRHGVIDRRLPSGEPLPTNWALQHPNDYLESLESAVRDAVGEAGIHPDQVVGIGTDFTACTVMPTAGDGTPLCLTDDHAGDPHAWPKLWKHHAAQAQADRINAAAEERDEAWRHRYGGKQSSEWQLAKALEVFEAAPAVFAEMTHWVEAADWIVWQLTGRLTRNEALAGYKAARQDDTGPTADFLDSLAPGFSALTAKSEGPFGGLGEAAGQLTTAMATRLGLHPAVTVSVGNVDAHVAAPAARSLEPGRLLAVMGTSTCHILNGASVQTVPGICGVVRDGVVRGSWGYEAGQSGVGDVFGWVTRTMATTEVVQLAEASGRSVHEILTEQAAELGIGEHGLVALDWLSGNRSVLVDHELSGAIVGLTLATEPHHIYRAMLEATVFGTRIIVDAFQDAGVPVDQLVVTGGLAKNQLLMQLTADITGRNVRLAPSDQGPALGSAVHAAVAAGAYADVTEATEAMVPEAEVAYRPADGASAAYEPIFADYRTLHDHFGRTEPMMKRLLAGRRAQETH